MKNIILPITVALFTIFSSCSVDLNGKKSNDIEESLTYTDRNAIKENRKVSNFEHVDISSAFNVVVSDNDFNGNVVVSAPDYAMEKIVTKVVNGTLKVYVDGSLSMKNGEKLEITFPHRKLRDIKLSGASKLVAKHAMKLDKLDVNLSGASSLDLNVISNSINLENSGASKFILKGNAKDFEVKVSGASKIEAEELKASKVRINASGASSAKIWAVDNLIVDASGASKVYVIKQNGLKKSINTSGASKVSEI
ncbi:head GIN domain-containing protein [Faecalibacter bovis]|uniref:DUF2807 domain-containing protein n=1 Tax=Faecalibacter bovis TaxID=2898187 RepID=A0ABX7XEP1_9FLAO|nr:head GIN domain-containing protein [Faecalibacter bovis]QTV06257.1 DUF2807 domain-containing protein [Faecalibacter bovis]